MPTISSGSKVQVAYIAEVTAGTTPATPQTIAIPYVKFSAELDRNTISDPSRTADNQKRFMSAGSYKTAGSLEVALSHSQFDPLLEAALMGTWTTNVLKVSNIQKYFTFEEFDSTLSFGRVFTGVEVDSLKLSIKPTDAVSAVFALMGRGHTVVSTSIDVTPTAIIAGKNPMTGAMGSLTIDGASALVTSIDLSVTNSIKMINTIGSPAATASTNGSKSITGTLTVLLENATLYNKFIANTNAALAFTISDGTNTYTFSIPKCAITKANASADSADERILSIDFEGLRDETLGAIMSITRT